MEEQRNTDGRFTSEHPDGEVLAAVRAHEPAATSEVADELDMTRQGADRRLRSLRDGGRVNSKKIGASLVWFAPDAESGREPAETPSTGTDDRPDPSPDAAGESAQTTPQDAADPDPPAPPLAHVGDDTDAWVRDTVADVSDGWEDTDSRLAARREAARAVLGHAAVAGDAVGKSTATEQFLPAYAVDGQNPETWWRKNIRPVLRAVGEYDNGRHGYTVDAGAERT